MRIISSIFRRVAAGKLEPIKAWQGIKALAGKDPQESVQRLAAAIGELSDDTLETLRNIFGRHGIELPTAVEATSAAVRQRRLKIPRFEGDWVKLRKLSDNIAEIDFHRGPRPPDVPYKQVMDRVRRDLLETIKEGHENGLDYVLVRHGYSTSRPGRMTARSVVRKTLRDKDITPYVDRSQTIQHNAVTAVALKPKRLGGGR